MEKIQFNKDNIVYPFDVEGKESIIYLYRDLNVYGQDVLLKYFRDTNTEQIINDLYKQTFDWESYIKYTGRIISDKTLENKRKKLEIIPSIPELSDEVNILDSIYCNDSFKGYTMDKEYLKPIPDDMKKKKRIQYLKILREKIRKLNECGIYIGDFNSKNFLASDDLSIVKLCDLDNMKYGDLDFDTKHIFIQYYETKNINKEFIDSFCFNMYTIALLNDIAYDISDILNSGLPKVLNSKENRDIFDSMFYLDSSYQYKFLIDNLR